MYFECIRFVSALSLVCARQSMEGDEMPRRDVVVVVFYFVCASTSAASARACAGAGVVVAALLLLSVALQLFVTSPLSVPSEVRVGLMSYYGFMSASCGGGGILGRF